MHSKIHELVFHEKQAPIYAIACTKEYLITGGADLKIMVWTHKFEYVTTLTRHQTPIMLIKYLNETQFMSASDDGHCIIWQKSDDPEQLFVPCHSFMKSQTIADIAVYHPYIIIATISTIYIHQYQELIHRMDFTGKLIQGVCFDPLEQIITIQFSDGGIRHLIPTNKKYNEIRVSKLCVGDFNRMIFRKCEWLPDASGCLCVAGFTSIFTSETEKHKMNSTLLFSRAYLDDPICTYATPLKQVTCVVIYPIPLKLKSQKNSVLGTPYRYVFAALSTDGLQLWDTEHMKPIMTAKGFHYAHLTDAIFIPSQLHQWPGNESMQNEIRLLITSADGFISEITFENTEFGEVYEIDQEDEWLEMPEKAWAKEMFNNEGFKSAKTEKLVMQIKRKNEHGDLQVVQ
eukprot:NODE_286_length_10728_cov_0.553298.p5 type:complete len:401 gc:universal NODE_286_length_10728_cov_0.553298:8680-9882(+)